MKILAYSPSVSVVEDTAARPTDGRLGPIVQLEGVRKSFGDNLVLDGIDLEVATGEVLVIIGPSGSGKSTLLRCVNLLEPIQAGPDLRSRERRSRARASTSRPSGSGSGSSSSSSTCSRT